MGSFTFRFPPSRRASEAFSDIPKRVSAFLRDGFRVFGRVYPRQPSLILTLALQSVGAGFEVESLEISKKLDVSSDEARLLLGALNFLTMLSTVPERKETPDAVIRAMISSGIAEEADRDSIQHLFSDLLEHRSETEQALQRASVSSEVLPSLTEFETTIDLRPLFEKEEIGLIVPVLVVHLDTDASHQEVWFQMSKEQVEKMIEDLRKALSQMQSAENWTKRRA